MMSSDKKQRNTKTFIVVTNETGYSQRAGKRTLQIQPCAKKMRLRVGAKNEKHARELVKRKFGPSTSVNAIWEVPAQERQLPNGTVINDLA